MSTPHPPPHVVNRMHPVQRPPQPGECRRVDGIEWSTYDPTFLRELPSTLADLEEFVRQCRAKGAPSEALVTGLNSPACKWYSDQAPPQASPVIPPYPSEIDGVTPGPTEDMAFWIDAEGDVWFEREPDSFAVWHASSQQWSPSYFDKPLEDVISLYMGWPAHMAEWTSL